MIAQVSGRWTPRAAAGCAGRSAPHTKIANDTLPPSAPQPGGFRVIVTPGYAETLGLKLVEGRFYEEGDLAPGRRLFVVDQSFARKFFPNGSAVGGGSHLAAGR